MEWNGMEWNGMEYKHARQPTMDRSPSLAAVQKSSYWDLQGQLVCFIPLLNVAPSGAAFNRVLCCDG